MPLLIAFSGLRVLERVSEVEILSSLDLLPVRARSRPPADWVSLSGEVSGHLLLD